ncbi:MAG: hypothetical protein QOI68_2713, partial [Pseudonocardiales bacterium]|nr:hypothetical protein [Pseudonocardiales bacterium]
MAKSPAGKPLLLLVLLIVAAGLVAARTLRRKVPLLGGPEPAAVPE